MELNDLLSLHDIAPKDIVVMRHRPYELKLRKVLPWYAAEKPEIYNAYQSIHGPRVESSLQHAKFIASFMGHQAGQALFVGLYKINGYKPITYKEYWNIPANKEMKKHGMVGWTKEENKETALWFSLERTDFYKEWKGKLIVKWPPPERSWWRRAERNNIPIYAIKEESLLEAAMPDWDELKLSWNELSLIPSTWKTILSQWRGIYYIFDLSDGKGYVGSAYGADNILGRWQNYAHSGHGGNKFLVKRNPENFTFSVLQRVSPDMEPKDVITLEGKWKERLHTRSPLGLNDN